MEKIYIAYERKVNNEMLYFVKGFCSFPNVPNAATILENYGMHRNLLKACRIAQIQDERIILSLKEQFIVNDPEGKLIPMASIESKRNRFLENTRIAFFKLKLASLF
ncbi:MAG: hypothetical protein ABI208_06370 [Ginsengibacter sp.]|jgi:hypothetical protein